MENKIKFQILRKIGGAFFLLALVFVLAQMVLAKDNTGYFKIKDSYIEIQETDYPQNVALVKKENGKEEIAGQVKIVDQYLISDIPENEFLDEYSYLKQGFQDLTISLETDQPLFDKENFYYSSSLLDKIKVLFDLATLPEDRITKEVDKSASVKTNLDLKEIRMETHYQDSTINNQQLAIKQTITLTNNSDQDLETSLLLKHQISADKIYWNNQEYIITENARKFVNPDKISFGRSFYDFSDVPDEFEPELWAENKDSQNLLILSLNVSFSAGETKTIDPTYGVEITILNVHSHPQAGDNWTVSFETKGTANLTITPDDQQSIDDLDFLSLNCGEEQRTPQILEGDVIFYPNWFCEGTGGITHLVNVAKNHVLKFQFGDEIAYAYNSPGTEILRPNASTTETNIGYEYPSGSDHYLLVDEETADEDDTYVRSDVITGIYARDLYNLPAHSEGSGTINFIKVYARCKANGTPVQASLKIALKTGGTAYESSELTVTSSYAPYSNQWDTNPGDGGWTWDDIDALQIGISLRNASGSPAYYQTYCTQVYVVVDYTLNVAPTVSSVSLNNGGDITLTPNDTTSVSATATVTDENGYGNIDTVTGKIYRSGVSGAEGCTNDNNDCYEDASCDLTGCDGNSCTATCTIDMEYYADPTDAGSYSGQYWRAWVEVTDEAEETGSAYSPADSPDVETQLAFSLSVDDTAGPNSPGTMADDNAVGTVAWQSPDNAKVSDDNHAPAGMDSGDYTHYLKATNFGFLIPSGATIDGILVEIEKDCSYSRIRDSEVKIVKSDGSIGATNKGDTVTNWPASDAYVSHGGSEDLWDETWSSDDINNSNFGVVLSAYCWTAYDTASVDHIRITVDYTTDTINYGEMSLGTNTGATNETVNIINTGNVQMDVMFDGYGAGDGDGKAMVCDTGSIIIGNEKYDMDETPTADYGDLAFPLTDTATERDWDVLQRTNDTAKTQGEDQKWSYWGLAIPAEGVGGSCSGYVTFTAVNDAGGD